ncbi:MAG: CHAT domain-containing protein [Rhizomicrobium sp.]|nr:CHAT domain-containing protein [Rhizomicrobium sp.]
MIKLWQAALAAAMFMPTAWAAGPSHDLKEEGFGAAQGVLVSAAADALTNVGAQLSGSSGPLAAMAAEGNTLLSDGEALRRQLDRLADDPTPEAEARRKAVQIQIDANQNALERFRQRLVDVFPAYAELTSPRPISSADVRAILNPGEGMLLIVPTEFATYTFALTHERFEWQRSALTATDVANRVAKLRCNLDAELCKDKKTAATFDRQAAYDLYREFVAPAKDTFKGSKTIFVLTAGALQSLPLEVLRTVPPDTDVPGNGGWLVDDYAMLTLPAVSSLISLRCYMPRDTAQHYSGCHRLVAQSGRSTGTLAFAGVGDPKLEGEATGEERRDASTRINYVRDGLAIPENLRRLPPLRGTREELERLSALFHSGPETLLLESAATETNVKQSAPVRNARILVFATHALMGNEGTGGGEPGLVMTPPEKATEADDGLLTGSEVAALKLSADFVVLSACNTARTGDDLNADGLAGLARAFFFAGARTMLVSHWRVFDDVPKILMADTFAALAQAPQDGRALAFQTAVLALKARPNQQEPSRWGAFILVGDTQ